MMVAGTSVVTAWCKGEILGPTEVGDDEMQGAVEREGSEFMKHLQCAKHGVESQLLRIR